MGKVSVAKLRRSSVALELLDNGIRYHIDPCITDPQEREKVSKEAIKWCGEVIEKWIENGSPDGIDPAAL